MRYFKIALVSLIIMVGLASCRKEPIIIPEFKTATEQYIFAKNFRDTTFFEYRKGEKPKKRNEAILLAYKSVIARFPDDVRVTPLAWVDLADIHYRMKRYRKAAELYEEALRKYPDQEDIVCKALYGAGCAHDHLKDYEKALSFYKQCFERFGNDERPYLAILGRQAKLKYSRIRIR